MCAGRPPAQGQPQRNRNPIYVAAMPKQKRVLYCSDARHYYLFAMEPPMSDADAWRCVDDVAATSVDTFVYMVERGDGLFYPSKV